MELSTGNKLKALRSDNGGEYLSQEFKDYLKEEGVRHELTVAKTPEQNGVAERMNRTVVETARCMLSQAKLPHKFWAEAVTTAVYLRNRSPTVAVKGMTPFECLTGRKPKVDYFKVFGCLAYAHIPRDERKKFDAKAMKCIFMGYGETTKAYRLYNLNTQRVLYSRDVTFDESKFPFQKESVTDCENDLVSFTNIDCEDSGDDADIPEVAIQRPVRQRQRPQN